MPGPRSSHWRAIALLVRPNASRYALLLGVIVVANLAVLAGPVVLREIIDRATAGVGRANLTRLGLLYLGLAIGSQLLALTVSWLATSSAWDSANTLRLRLAGHVLELDHDFHRAHNPGELIQRIDGDVSSVSDFLAAVLVRVMAGLVLVVGVVVVVSVLDWRLGLGMALYASVAGWLVFAHREHSVREAANEMSAAAQLYGGIEEQLTATEDLRANGAGSFALWRFVTDTINYIGAATNRERAFLGLWRRLQTAIVAGSALAIGVGAIGVDRGLMSLGTAFLLYQYSLQIRRPLEDILHELEIVQKANGAMSRVTQLMDTSPSVADDGFRSPPAGPLAVRFDHVSFHYGDRPSVLSEVDLEIAAGRSVGVIGHTGGGKTTLSRLLGRLVEATDGELRLSGVPIADIPLAELRARVTLIPQTVELLKGTIRDNVALFDQSISDADVDHALSQVGLDRLGGPVMHQLLGPGGTGLSAGEGQLLALARAWLRWPDLVVLDEPTARIDPATEAQLEQAVAALFAGRSVVVIAHRLSTLRLLDDIVVVEEGRVVEYGERAALERDPGSRYRELLGAGLETIP